MSPLSTIMSNKKRSNLHFHVLNLIHLHIQISHHIRAFWSLLYLNSTPYLYIIISLRHWSLACTSSFPYSGYSFCSHHYVCSPATFLGFLVSGSLQVCPSSLLPYFCHTPSHRHKDLSWTLPCISAISFTKVPSVTGNFLKCFASWAMVWVPH